MSTVTCVQVWSKVKVAGAGVYWFGGTGEKPIDKPTARVVMSQKRFSKPTWVLKAYPEMPEINKVVKLEVDDLVFVSKSNWGNDHWEARFYAAPPKFSWSSGIYVWPRGRTSRAPTLNPEWVKSNIPDLVYFEKWRLPTDKDIENCMTARDLILKKHMGV